jgi:hypothetical protein
MLCMAITLETTQSGLTLGRAFACLNGGWAVSSRISGTRYLQRGRLGHGLPNGPRSAMSYGAARSAGAARTRFRISSPGPMRSFAAAVSSGHATRWRTAMRKSRLSASTAGCRRGNTSASGCSTTILRVNATTEFADSVTRAAFVQRSAGVERNRNSLESVQISVMEGWRA